MRMRARGVEPSFTARISPNETHLRTDAAETPSERATSPGLSRVGEEEDDDISRNSCRRCAKPDKREQQSDDA
jgi:hypothetical protein